MWVVVNTMPLLPAALLPRKKNSVPFVEEAGWSPERSGECGNSPLQGFDPRPCNP